MVPDRRRPLAHEVYSIDRVVASSPSGESVEYPAVLLDQARAEPRAERTYWHATRRPAEATMATGDRGTEVFLSLVDLGFRPSAPAGRVLEVETTCLNRDLPEDLPFGGDQPRLQLAEGAGRSRGFAASPPPTRTLRPDLGHGLLWRLISHLSLNHLSLVENGNADALREILRLYDFADSAETREPDRRHPRRVAADGWWERSRARGRWPSARGPRSPSSSTRNDSPGAASSCSPACWSISWASTARSIRSRKMVATVKGREGGAAAMASADGREGLV